MQHALRSLVYATSIDQRRGAPRTHGSRGFTLTELLIAMAMIGLMASSAIWALAIINSHAAVSRLYTGAMTAAQTQIDLILSDTPFDPQLGDLPTGGELNLGTQNAECAHLYRPFDGQRRGHGNDDDDHHRSRA